MNRDAKSMKLSVHASGQIHVRLERRDLQLLAPPLPLDGSSWDHTVEIRYLISPDRFRPTPKKLKKKEKAYLVDVADGNALVLNLIVARSGTTSAMPPQFSGAQPLWKSTLADGRQALLLARVMPLNEENQEHIARVRGANGLKVTYAGETPPSPHVELAHVFWSTTGGNVILIIPAGTETIRKLGKPASLESAGSHRRQPEVDCECPNASVELRAPNGARVAVLALEGGRTRVTLSKNEHIATQLGQFRLTRFDENLIAGQKFELPPVSLLAAASVAGLRPREWNYRVSCAYDGTDLSVTIRPISAALRIGESDSHPDLRRDEQVLLTAPSSALTINAAPGHSSFAVALNATLLLCDVDHA